MDLFEVRHENWMVGIRRKLNNKVNHDIRRVERGSSHLFTAKGMLDRNFRIASIAMRRSIQNSEPVTI